MASEVRKAFGKGIEKGSQRLQALQLPLQVALQVTGSSAQGIQLLDGPKVWGVG